MEAHDLSERHAEQIIELIAVAMNRDEAEFARKTLEYHFFAKHHGIDDGREYIGCFDGERLIGVVGLHHYIWGPKENVWLGWFAVDPQYQKQGIGHTLITLFEERARERGYTKLFVETYSHADFEKARRFYPREGYREAGRIENYLADGSDMVVYAKFLK